MKLHGERGLIKFNFIGAVGNDELFAIGEVLSQFSHQIDGDGVTVEAFKMENGLSLAKSDGIFTLGYSSRTTLMRAVGHLIENADANPPSCFINEEPRYSMLGVSLDNSRNAVMNISAVKRMCRVLAAMGYNTMMLYTEDTYEMEKYPYFGYMRGRFSTGQLKECDEYAEKLGIELVPCIQTLAHLNAIFRWPAFAPLNDCKDILLAGDEKTYELIESMIAALSKSVRSRKINIGMDEAHMLGRGKYLERNGYEPRGEIIRMHLKRVSEICEKYGYNPMMWSDMFFRRTAENDAYYSMEDHITSDVVDSVPENISLIYWDYYNTDESMYDAMIAKHKKFKNEMIFAGGAWIWSGIVPCSKFSFAASQVAVRSIVKNDVRQVVVTTWGDNGAVCSRFSALANFQLYAESCYCDNLSRNDVKRRLKACAGADLDDFLDMDMLNHPPDRADDGEYAINPTRYMMFQDILAGLFDRHIAPGTGEFYKKMTPIMAAAAKRNPNFAPMFDSMTALSNMLAVKSEIGVELKAAYDCDDRHVLADMKDSRIPLLISRVEELYECVRVQWLAENKSFGLDVQDIRFGGLLMRLKQAQRMLAEYLNGQRDCIEELEEKRLFADGREDDSLKQRVTFNNEWSEIVTANTL